MAGRAIPDPLTEPSWGGGGGGRHAGRSADERTGWWWGLTRSNTNTDEAANEIPSDTIRQMPRTRRDY